MKMTRRCAVALAILIGCPRGSPAQGIVGSIQGVVRSETGVLEGVTVSVVGTSLGAVTRTDGRYTIANVPAGTQTVRAARLGFARREFPVVVVPGQAVTLNIDLRSAAVALEQVVVTGTAPRHGAT